MGKETSEITDYINRLHRSLRKGGSLLVIEIEKTDNLFARILFEDILGLKEPLGLQKEELKNVLERIGFKTIEVIGKSGLLYALARKP
jgi:ubiquinone/menaquinone biosynthesis C-methylase UbiE